MSETVVKIKPMRTRLEIEKQVRNINTFPRNTTKQDIQIELLLDIRWLLARISRDDYTDGASISVKNIAYEKRDFYEKTKEKKQQ